MEKKIYVREEMSESQKIKTTIHEIAHGKLHDKDLLDEKENLPDKRTREIQAESIAYVVSTYYGLDTSDYSFGYIASWSKDKELQELKASLNIIRKTSSEIIDSIDKSLERMREKELVDNKVEGSGVEMEANGYIPLNPSIPMPTILQTTPLQATTKSHGRSH